MNNNLIKVLKELKELKNKILSYGRFFSIK